MGYIFKKNISRDEKKADIKYLIKTLGWILFWIIFILLTFWPLKGGWDWYDIVFLIIWLIMLFGWVIPQLEQDFNSK